MKKAKPLSWAPELGPNGTYCSPACGGSCEKVDHDRCVREAIRLAKRLGRQYEWRVWENLGWHYEAFLRADLLVLRVFPVYGGKWPTVVGYTCLLGQGGGFPDWRDMKHPYKDPRKAAAAQLKIAEEWTAIRMRDLAALKGWTEGA